MWSGLSSPDSSFFSTSSINDGAWHHVVATNDGSVIRLYLDAVYLGSVNSGLGMDNVALYLGAVNNAGSGASHLHEGFYDDFAFWNRAFDIDEIDYLYNSGNGREVDPSDSFPSSGNEESQGLLTYYKMDENFWVSQMSAPSDAPTSFGGVTVSHYLSADNTYAYGPSVIKDGDIYKMWYSGYNASWKIYYATSTDGIVWVKYDNTIPTASNTTGTNGRIPLGSAVIVEGGPGSGKTLFCLQECVDACEQGKKVLFMSFEEPEKNLRSHLNMFNFDSIKYEKEGLLRIKRFNALDIARSVEALLSEAKKELLIDVQPILIPQDFAPDIVFIDSLTSISSAFSGESNRFRVYMEQLFRYLEAHNITSFLIMETPHPTHLGQVIAGIDQAVSFLSDGIIVIYNVVYANGKRGRAVEVLKMRGENINRKIVEMEIKDKVGIVISPDKQIKGEYTLT